MKPPFHLYACETIERYIHDCPRDPAMWSSSIGKIEGLTKALMEAHIPPHARPEVAQKLSYILGFYDDESTLLGHTPTRKVLTEARDGLAKTLAALKEDLETLLDEMVEAVQSAAEPDLEDLEDILDHMQAVSFLEGEGGPADAQKFVEGLTYTYESDKITYFAWNLLMKFTIYAHEDPNFDWASQNN